MERMVRPGRCGRHVRAAQLRQGKPGSGGCDEIAAETARYDPAGGSSPPDQGWQPVGNESCVVRGRPRLRSVDSECRSRVIEPRKKPLGEPALSARWSATGAFCEAMRAHPPGVCERGNCTRVLQEPGRSVHLRREIPVGHPGYQALGSGRPPRAADRRKTQEARRRRAADGTFKRRKRSAEGRVSRSRSACMVPVKRGNRPEGPRGGKAGAGS